jgi:hypothetical protein
MVLHVFEPSRIKSSVFETNHKIKFLDLYPLYFLNAIEVECLLGVVSLLFNLSDIFYYPTACWTIEN